jgi:menaquinone-specific isochorismate synthase
MIDLKMEQLEMRLEHALKQIQSDEKYKLASFTKKIKSNHLLHVFEGAKSSNKDRFFWMSASRRLAFTAVGQVKTLEADENRFEQTEKQWKKLLNEAIIDNPYPTIPGTGILAFGGMAFDPLEERTELWKKFKQSQFYIPEMMLTEYDENYYLTWNIVLNEADDTKELADYLQTLGKDFLNGQPVEEQALKLNNEIEIDPEQWKQIVRKATKEITAKKAEKIVLAREVRFQFDQEVNIASVLEKLMDTQQNSYIYAFESAGDCFIGATPERLVKVENNDLLSTCLAGTAPRGKTEEEDKKIGEELLHDEKNRQEHEFVVKMIKNALLQSSTDVVIPKEPVLYPLTNLQHLYTPVTGQLK